MDTVLFNRYGLKVKADSLLPIQQKTSRKLLISADLYIQNCIKFPHRAYFHSYAEFLHAMLLEADASVTSFVPQPFSWQVGSSRYIPDCFYIRSGKRHVVEIKAGGEFPREKGTSLRAFCEFHKMQFDVIANESILEKEMEARNWCQMIQTLFRGRELDTDMEEHEILSELMLSGESTFGEIFSPCHRNEGFKQELALYRLAHRGKVSLELDQPYIGYDTRVTSCT